MTVLTASDLVTVRVSGQPEGPQPGHGDGVLRLSEVTHAVTATEGGEGVPGRLGGHLVEVSTGFLVKCSAPDWPGSKTHAATTVHPEGGSARPRRPVVRYRVPP